jgi:hypothetical protein
MFRDKARMGRTAPPMPRRLLPAAIVTIAFAGLALRLIVAARGGLWTDEAWSMVYALRAHDALGVFLRINHDNNHYLNSLWLQAVGPDATPLVARLPSALAGFGVVLVAGLIGARRGAASALAAALLFAAAPIMVGFGAEARGYGLLILAILGGFALTDRWLADPDRPPPTVALALVVLAGMLAHLTMAVAAGLLALWSYGVLRRRAAPSEAMRRTLRAWLPSGLAVLAVLILLVAAALASPLGYRLGGYAPFDLARFAAALAQIVTFTLGPDVAPAWIAPVLVGLGVAALVWRARGAGDPRRLFYALAILGLPLLVLIAQPGNASYARYYLVSAVALLLFAADLIGRALARPGRRRVAAFLILAAILGTGLWRDFAMLETRRGDPDGPVRAMAREKPAGARLKLGVERFSAPLALAARHARYRLVFVADCARADYLLMADLSPDPARTLCGRHWRQVAASGPAGLSGNVWTLYAPQALQRSSAPVSAPPPAG